MIKEYIEYLKDNPQKYWFKRKIFGWGWTPARWQGWAVLAVFTFCIAYIISNFVTNSPEPTTSELAWYLSKIFVLITLVIIIAYKTGEKPRWQWGIPKKEDNSK